MECGACVRTAEKKRIMLKLVQNNTDLNIFFLWMKHMINWELFKSTIEEFSLENIWKWVVLGACIDYVFCFNEDRRQSLQIVQYVYVYFIPC